MIKCDASAQEKNLHWQSIQSRDSTCQRKLISLLNREHEAIFQFGHYLRFLFAPEYLSHNADVTEYSLKWKIVLQ